MLLLFGPEPLENVRVLERRRVPDRLARGDRAQKAAHDLSGPGLRELVGETDVVGLGERADLFRDVAAELFAKLVRRLVARLERHEGRDRAPLDLVGPSDDLGTRIAGNFVRVTGSAPSNYVGDGTGLVTRKDLGGLNLSTVPKVFIECGNMRDSKDAALLTSGAWRQKAAQGISDGIVSFLRG